MILFQRIYKKLLAKLKTHDEIETTVEDEVHVSSVYSRQKARAREILGVEKKANISVTRLDIKTIFG